MKELLPVFSELLAEPSKIWKSKRKFTAKGALSWVQHPSEMMDAQSPPVAFGGQLSSAFSRRPTLPTKSEWFWGGLRRQPPSWPGLSVLPPSSMLNRQRCLGHLLMSGRTLTCGRK